MGFLTNIWNGFNKTILKSRMHGLTSRNIVLITFTGRKSGKSYTTPVNYTQDGNILRITSSTDRQWWRNLKANPEVELHLRGKAVRGTAQVFEELEEVADELAQHLFIFPQAARFFGVGTLEDGSFNRDDLLKASQGRVMVQIRVKG